MSRSSLCDYSKTCILAEETVTTVNTATATQQQIILIKK